MGGDGWFMRRGDFWPEIVTAVTVVTAVTEGVSGMRGTGGGGRSAPHWVAAAATSGGKLQRIQAATSGGKLQRLQRLQAAATSGGRLSEGDPADEIEKTIPYECGQHLVAVIVRLRNGRALVT